MNGKNVKGTAVTPPRGSRRRSPSRSRGRARVGVRARRARRARARAEEEREALLQSSGEETNEEHRSERDGGDQNIDQNSVPRSSKRREYETLKPRLDAANAESATLARTVAILRDQMSQMSQMSRADEAQRRGPGERGPGASSGPSQMASLAPRVAELRERRAAFAALEQTHEERRRAFDKETRARRSGYERLERETAALKNRVRGDETKFHAFSVERSVAVALQERAFGSRGDTLVTAHEGFCGTPRPRRSARSGSSTRALSNERRRRSRGKKNAHARTDGGAARRARADRDAAACRARRSGERGVRRREASRWHTRRRERLEHVKHFLQSKSVLQFSRLSGCQSQNFGVSR